VCALACDEFFGASDRRGKADAIFGALNIVVHCLGNGDDDPAAERARRTQRVVAADVMRQPTRGGQDFQARGSEVVVLAIERKLFDAIGWTILGSLDSAFLRGFVREVWRTVPPCVDRAVFSHPAGVYRVIGICDPCGKTFPSFANADNASAQSVARKRFDHGLRRNVAPTVRTHFIFCGTEIFSLKG